MRKVVFGGANSLDNYFARKDDTVDWIMWSDEVTEFLADYWKRFDTIVEGRRTYEVQLRMGASGEFPGVKSYVFSRTMKQKSTRGVEIISEDAAEFVRKLKAQKGKDICVMGGGLLARSLFDADLIDEVGFNIHPVLLGSGIPIFHEMDHQIDLERSFGAPRHLESARNWAAAQPALVQRLRIMFSRITLRRSLSKASNL